MGDLVGVLDRSEEFKIFETSLLLTDSVDFLILEFSLFLLSGVEQIPESAEVELAEILPLLENEEETEKDPESDGDTVLAPKIFFYKTCIIVK